MTLFGAEYSERNIEEREGILVYSCSPGWSLGLVQQAVFRKTELPGDLAHLAKWLNSFTATRQLDVLAAEHFARNLAKAGMFAGKRDFRHHSGHNY